MFAAWQPGGGGTGPHEWQASMHMRAHAALAQMAGWHTHTQFNFSEHQASTQVCECPLD